MSRRNVSGIFLSVLLLGMSAFAVQLAKSSPATITVPDDYLTIQEAINNAEDGDTIFVRNGIHNGTVVVSKTVALVGESREGTIIECPDREPPFWRRGAIIIEADNATIKGFMMNNADYYGIEIKSSGCLISGNNLVGNHEGIFLDSREPEVTVEGNVIVDNYISGNEDCGIVLLISCCNNQILNNTIVNSGYVGMFAFSNVSNNLIKRNEIVNNYEAGIAMHMGCSYNTIIYNNISFNGLGQYADEPCGIELNIQCVGNRIVANNMCFNKRGFYQRLSSDNNVIYHNNFIDNGDQVHINQYAPCINIWDDGYPSGGNYWSNYNGSDSYKGAYQNLTGSDGIGDTPYVIDNNNVDWYPLMEPYTHPLGDVNYDDEVDMQDIAIVAKAFGSSLGHPNWNPEADVNKDGKVDLKDIALVAKDFGK